MPAWEMFKPWAIISITIAVVLAFVLWASMIRFEYALIVSTATAAAALAYSPTEPYAAIIAVLLPPVFVLAWSGLRGATRSGGWAAVVGVGIFLGVAALFYTLLFGLRRVHADDHGRWCLPSRAAASSHCCGSGHRGDRRRASRCSAGGRTWSPRSTAIPPTPAPRSTTCPSAGAQLEFPMLHFTLLGALCMLGTLWLVVYARSSTRAGALAIAVLAVYAWSLLSMLTTLVGTTLLSFRLQPTLTILLTAAGAFGFIEVTRALAARVKPENSRRVVAAAATLGAIGALTFSQDIPDVLRSDIVVAYTDTDGNGERADRRPPGAEQYYREIDAKILRTTGLPRDETVVLTADYSFLSYYPYYGFQGLTSHYANPLAQFDKRADAIESWATLTTADQFIAALDKLPWKPPTVFLMRRGASDTYTLRLASDVYPNQPNVRRYHVELDNALFDDPRFDVSTVGPFVLAIRKPTS